MSTFDENSSSEWTRYNWLEKISHVLNRNLSDKGCKIIFIVASPLIKKSLIGNHLWLYEKQVPKKETISGSKEKKYGANKVN